MSDNNDNTPSSREKSSESEGNAYSSPDSKYELTQEQLEDLKNGYPHFKIGCEAHELPYLAKISEEDYEQFREKFALNTDNWNKPRNVGPETIRALNKDSRRGIIPFDGSSATEIATQKAKIEGWMTEFDETFSGDDRTLTESECKRQEDLLMWSGVSLVRSGKVYGSEGSFQRWLTLAEAFKERQMGSRDRSGLPFTEDFRKFEFYGYYLKIWDLRLEELAQSEEQ